jgi:hypothetical protein
MVFCQKNGSGTFAAAKIEHQVSGSQTHGPQHLNGQI